MTRLWRAVRVASGQRPAEPDALPTADAALQSALTAFDWTPVPRIPRHGEWLDDGVSALDFAVTDLRGLSPIALAAPLAQRIPARQRLWVLVLRTLLLLLVLPALAPELPVRVDALLAPGPPSAFAQSAFAQSAVIVQSADIVQNELLRDPRWAQLAQRALHLPTLLPGAPCPTVAAHVVAAGLIPALGSGPAYAVAASDDNGTLFISSASALHLPGRDWGGQFVGWYFDPHYQGPILIRGGQLDGPGLVRFNGGLDQQRYVYNLPDAPLIPALHLEADSSPGAPWPGWPSYTRLHRPGCYAYQVDGLTFSEVIVFRAAFEP